jgi:Ca-activated chloride channel homolog
MRFARIEMLSLIWMILPLLLFVLYGVRKRRRILFSWAKGKGRTAIAAEGDTHRRFIKAGLILLSLFFLTIALSGPQYGFKWEEVEQKGVEIIVALDCSKSMLAEDIKPFRLERAKREIVDLLSMLEGDRAGLAAFSGTAFLQCPLTLDYSAFYIFLNALTPDYLPKGGTDLSAALGVTLDGFSDKSSAEKAVILITDGENTGDDTTEAIERAREEGVKIFTIGVGTPGGVPIPDETGGYKKDDSGSIVVSRLDEGLLEKIAQGTGGVYVRSVAGDMDLKRIYENEIREKMETATIATGKKKVWQDRFQWFLAAALAALIAEMAVPAVRKTAVLLVAAISFCMFSPLPTHAQNAYDAVKKGVAAYDAQKYDKALEHFIDAQIRDPEKSEIFYNIGNAYYKLGRFDEAVKNYSAAVKSEDPVLKERAYYNMGNARFRQQQLKEAVSDYRSALDIDPGDQQASENLAFAEKVMEQQQQQENQSENSKEENEGKKNPDEDSGNADNRDPDKKDGEEDKQGKNKDREDKPSSGGDDPDRNEKQESPRTPSDEQNSPSDMGAENTSENDGAAEKASAEKMLNRLKDEPGKALMPSYSPEKVEKDW